MRRARAYLNEAQQRTPSLVGVNFDALLGPVDESARPEPNAREGSKDDENQEKLDSMMDSYGQMTLNNNGGIERDFYGAASGFAWIQKARDYFGDPKSSGSGENEEADANNSATVQLFDAPLPPKNTLSIDVPIPQLLPPRETTTKLLKILFSQVYPPFHFLHEVDFQDSTGRIYGQDPIEYNETDQSFLPLFNLVLGLGYLFSRDEHEKHGCRQALAQA